MASANPGLPSNWHPGFVQSKASLFRLSDKVKWLEQSQTAPYPDDFERLT